MSRFYCPMCERFVRLSSLAMDVLPPINSEPKSQAIYEASEIRYRYSHLTCGEVVEDRGSIPEDETETGKGTKQHDPTTV